MSIDIEKGKIGSSFEDFLKEQGTYEETTERAVKRVLAFQLAEEMKAKGITKVKMAEMLDTSRSQLNRLLDPEADNVTLSSLSKVARLMGRSIHLELR
jgi:predicted XRE-type DNA-binding protein